MFCEQTTKLTFKQFIQENRLDTYTLVMTKHRQNSDDIHTCMYIQMQAATAGCIIHALNKFYGP